MNAPARQSRLMGLTAPEMNRSGSRDATISMPAVASPMASAAEHPIRMAPSRSVVRANDAPDAPSAA
jgi:hypothetical protein